MKKQALATLSMLSFMLVLTLVTISAQSAPGQALNIPFDFVVGQRTLPAGEYIVQPHRTDFYKVWLIQSKDGHTSALFTVMQTRSSETQEQTKLVFHKYGAQNFLSQIWTPGGNTGYELLMPRLERELAQQAGKGQKVVVNTGGRK